MICKNSYELSNGISYTNLTYRNILKLKTNINQSNPSRDKVNANWPRWPSDLCPRVSHYHDHVIL